MIDVLGLICFVLGIVNLVLLTAIWKYFGGKND